MSVVRWVLRDCETSVVRCVCVRRGVGSGTGRGGCRTKTTTLHSDVGMERQQAMNNNMFSDGRYEGRFLAREIFFGHFFFQKWSKRKTRELFVTGYKRTLNN